MLSPAEITAGACDPRQQVSVMASAGTGKTWLLVTRLIRLLLAGARPGSILAITFTQKAAREMRERLDARLADLLEPDDDVLDERLRALGLEPDRDLRRRARRLYERLLLDPEPIRITTFHAFCHDLLRHFPVEAEIAADFELADEEGLLRQEAMDAVLDTASRVRSGPLARSILALIEHTGGHDRMLSALAEFLAHRGDWRALTATAERPVAYAASLLQQRLGLDDLDDPIDDLDRHLPPALLSEYAELLSRHRNATNERLVAALDRATDPGHPAETRLDALCAALLTKEGTPRSQKASRTRARAMGEDGQERFLALHADLCERLLELIDRRNRLATHAACRHWYHAGHALLEAYEAIKRERRLLDFDDLEWQACRLLNDPEHGPWIQYRLDERIDHLLVDEFQDTNPTQWRLLLPLLEELAAGRGDEGRSLFLVGDTKQSIYRFRRANPALFEHAADWIDARLGGRRYPLVRSWRSAPAIVDGVNRVFGAGDLADDLPGFIPHETHLRDLHGRIEILPLVGDLDESKGEAVPIPTFRDPLTTPRADSSDDRHRLEGRLIAGRIGEILERELPVGPEGSARPIRPADIMILVRQRTHVHEIERALLQAGIPFDGGSRRSLLDHLEVQDLLALLDVLGTPADDLALAQVVRSPVFGGGDDDLIALARRARELDGHWYAALTGTDWPANPALSAAAERLPAWRRAARRLPTHDLLDRIVDEADLERRYLEAFPAHLHKRVLANLSRLVELALEIDSGRYPSHGRFVERLRRLDAHREDLVGEPDADPGADSVRILTIHGAKGLEAAAVFLADCARNPRPRTGQCLVEWPVEDRRPRTFMLVGDKARRDRPTREALERQQREAAAEDARLLYVALTRARQYLFVSGSRERNDQRQRLGWYGAITRALWPDDEGAFEAAISNGLAFDGERPVAPPRPTAGTEPAPSTAAAQEIRADRPPTRRRPATEGGAATPDDEARLRGTAIHRMLERLTEPNGMEADDWLPTLARELRIRPDDRRLRDWLAEARRVVEAPALARLFDPDGYTEARNEVPLLFTHGGRQVRAVIDRLIVSPDELVVVDYKTRRLSAGDVPTTLAMEHAGQLGRYALGLRRIWPDDRPIRLLVVFTVRAAAVEIPLDAALERAGERAPEPARP